MAIENTLQQRIDRAIEEYKKAVEVYAEVKALLDNYDEESDASAFLKCKNLYGDLYGACDPLLRVFVIKNNIQCPLEEVDPTDSKKKIIRWSIITIT